MEKKPIWQEDLGKLKPRFKEFKLFPRGTALVIIDMQYQYVHSDYGIGLTLKEEGLSQAELDNYFQRLAKVVVPNQMKLLNFFRRNELRVIYVATGSTLPDKSDCDSGKTSSPPHVMDSEYKILEEIQQRPDELIIRKTSVGAFNSTSIDQILRNMGITCLVIAGVGTNACVETTARDASDRGYRCIMVDDACASFVQECHDHTLTTFSFLFGKVKSTDDVIEELKQEIMKDKS